MYVCLCHGVTDKKINESIDNGASTVKDLMKELKVATQCGSCVSQVSEMLDTKTKSKQYSQGINTSDNPVQLCIPRDYAVAH
ncbi:MAG: (2Fe-2S)-binding protein [Gammaproteobacteria bacterium]|nr:(2Fe-2S)-binding protein [Gammaproteobacteria bacterium]